MDNIILVVGSLNVDLVTYTDRIPNAGETITSAHFSTGCGGKGANQAVAAARMAGLANLQTSETSSGHSIHVQMAGSVGNDEFGLKILKEMREQGVDTRYVNTNSVQPTGTAVILVCDLYLEHSLVDLALMIELRLKQRPARIVFSSTLAQMPQSHHPTSHPLSPRYIT